ncbi:protein spire homolog 2, partial [Pteropus vampyrus]|uniref:Protein spire homolog 2 n=1 Tax=Pteropus vampyrus TaxID=132908 RepID=A0A6P6BTQ1_PTEVA
IRDTADIVLRRDGSVSARLEPDTAEPTTMVLSPASSEAQMVQSLGFAIYRALDWGLDESEERELSPQLEQLIDLMANNDGEDGGCGAADEGYGGPEEEEEAEGGPRAVRSFAQAMRLCAARLTDPRGAQAHYQAVCRALFLETLELRAFLARVREAKEGPEAQRCCVTGSQPLGPMTRSCHLSHLDAKDGQFLLPDTHRCSVCLELRGSGQLSERHCPGPACNSPALFSMPSVVVAHFTDEQLEALRDCPSPQAALCPLAEVIPLQTPGALSSAGTNSSRFKQSMHKTFRKSVAFWAETAYSGMSVDAPGRVDGDIPPRVKKDAHELILDFIRSRPPLKQVSERRLRPVPQKQRTLHEKILEEIKQERRLRPVGAERWGGREFGSLPCILNACSGDVKSTSCINLSTTDAGSGAPRPRPRVLLKAPTLAEMEEMNTSEEEESPCGEVTLKRDRSFSEHDLDQLRSEALAGLQPATQPPGGSEPRRVRAGSMHAWRPCAQEPGFSPVSVQSQPDPSSSQHGDLGSAEDRPEASVAPDTSHLWLEFSHPVESLALTVEEVMDVRRVLVKAEMEKFLQNKELFNSLKKGKICCCCRTKFPLFSWPPTCLFCKRAVCTSCSIKMKMPSKKLSHIPVYTLGFESPQRTSTARSVPARRGGFQSLQGPPWRSVEEEFPHMYAHGRMLKDVCSDCTSFVADVVCSSRRSVDALNATPRRARQTQSLYVPNTWTLDFK